MAKTPTWQRAEGKNCPHCQRFLSIDFFYSNGKLADGSKKYNSWCKDCTKDKMSSYHRRTWGKDKLSYIAHKRTKSPRAYLTYLLSKAKRRGPCSITIENLEDIWNAQNGYCALSGWQMTMRLADGVVPTNASIDRIDSSVGYELGNVQLVCRAANVAKHDLTMNEFILLCKAISEKNNV